MNVSDADLKFVCKALLVGAVLLVFLEPTRITANLAERAVRQESVGLMFGIPMQKEFASYPQHDEVPQELSSGVINMADNQELQIPTTHQREQRWVF
ncbi:hypothetical protein D3C81_958370 [compost metagenome]